MSGDVEAWLDGRVPAPPPALRAHVQQFVALTDQSGSVASILGSAALDAMSAALGQIDERAGAFDLLAADALVTYAMEAAAEQGSETVDAVADAFGSARLAALLTDRL